MESVNDSNGAAVYGSSSGTDNSTCSTVSPSLNSFEEFVNGINAENGGASTQREVSQELFTDSEVSRHAASSAQSRRSSAPPSVIGTTSGGTNRASSSQESWQLPTIPTPRPVANFDWTARPSATPANAFDDSLSGWTVPISNEMNELEFWNLVFPTNVLNTLVTESNNYASKIITAAPNPSRRQRNLKEITQNEMLRYFVIRILMGIDNKPELSHYWSTDPIFRHMVIPQIMSSDRFFEIQRYLHLCNDEEEAEDEERDKLHKVRAVWEMAMQHFSSLLVPYGKVSVDESLTKFRGRLSFRQFIPSKRNRFGFKSFSITDEETKFVLNSKIYIGAEQGQSETYPKSHYGYGGSVLLDLAEPYFGENRTVFADNYFMSPVVAEKLLQEHTFAIGTLRAGRKHTPPAPKLKKGETAVFCCEKENFDIQVEYWRDKKIVRMLSTGQEHSMIDTTNFRGTVKRKLETITKYNQYAHGIDLADMFIGYYDSSRKTVKRPTKVFFRLLELFMYNSFVMMRTLHPSKPFLDFKLNLSRQLLEYTGGITFEKIVRQPRMDVERLCDDRLKRRCFMGKSTSRRCVVCSKHGEQKRTIYFCKNCDVPLCAVPCFEIYHTQKSY